MKKLLCILLSALMIFSMAACKKNQGSGTEEGNVTSLRETYNGVHDFTATDTDDFLIRNGYTEYTLVVPAGDKTDYMQLAQDEFVLLFKEATGVTLKVITDRDLTHSAQNRYISLGETTLTSVTDIANEKSALDTDGYRIVTVDKTIFIYGGSNYGTVFGVYGFMKVTFNFEQYYVDVMEIDRDVRTLPLKNYAVTDIPDFIHRAWSNNILVSTAQDKVAGNEFAFRMGYKGPRGYNYMPVFSDYNTTSTKRQSTNTLTYLPLETYQTAHPKWFADTNKELCYTARGDEDELELMIQEVAKKIEFSLTVYTPEQYPQYNCITFTQEDNYPQCGCSECLSAVATDGGYAGVYIKFLNRVAEKVETWMNAPENADYKRDDFKIYMFAYRYTLEAPVKYDEASNCYVPVSPDVVMRPDTGIVLAILPWNYQMDFWSEENVSVRENVTNWGLLTDNIRFWLYGTNFTNYMWMFDSFNYFYDGAFAWLANRSRNQIFVQEQEGSHGSHTSWHNLKVYLDAKLQWDTSLDTEELIAKFFKAMYGDAQDAMLNLFYGERTYYNKLVLEERGLTSNYSGLGSSALWPLAMCKGWLSQLDAAKELVSDLKDTDFDQYELICKHIESECIMPMYLILSLHVNTITEAEKRSFIDRMYYDIDWMNLNMSVRESKSPLKDWLDSFN